MHRLNQDDETLSKAKLYLTYVEIKSRFKGWKTKVKSDVAELIYGYILSIMALRGGDTNIIQRKYPNFKQPSQEGVDEKEQEKWNLDNAHLPELQITDLAIDVPNTEDLIEKDTKAITLTEPLRFKFKMAFKTQAKLVNVCDLQKFTSEQIQRLFLVTKKSTHHIDKAELRDVCEAFKQKRAKEMELDTRRVKFNLKMINIFGHSRYVSLRVKDINQVTNISHLTMFPKGLDATTNALEQQAMDLLKARIEELPVIIEANKKVVEEKAKHDRLSKLKKRRK